ncbi:hypothetical protein [Anatilimnocola floriformis]|uniref:hypothetical protein n=1 Tax=Anatilimnocola floriformis TaxID=2948575 RepID=UPI0020C2A102|nr:hypothetical protein [Anatilimnocola floriformis]
MKQLLLILILLFATAGCDINLDVSGPAIHGRSYITEPVCNLPVTLRQTNWLSPSREGSCTHATVTTALRWQNRPHTANEYAATHSGGETPQSLAAQLNAAGIRYVDSVGQNDVAFLEWAIATRRGCLVTVMGGRHAVFLADLTPTHACLIDNNAPQVPQWIERDAFLSEWQQSHSWALAVLYSPVPELP